MRRLFAAGHLVPVGGLPSSGASVSATIEASPAAKPLVAVDPVETLTLIETACRRAYEHGKAVANGVAEEIERTGERKAASMEPLRVLFPRPRSALFGEGGR